MTTMVPVSGNTYPVKEQLKALGARWNGVDKVWMVPADKVADAQLIVDGAPTKAPRNSAAGEGWSRKRASGFRGRRSGCRCAKPLDEGDGECMYCGYQISYR